MEYTNIKKTERRLRPFLFSLLAFNAAFAAINEYLTIPTVTKFILLPILLLISLPIGKKLSAEIERFFFSLDWDEHCVIVEYRIMKRVLQGTGVVILFFYLQMGAAILYYPPLAHIKMFNVPLFLPFIAANCYMFILLYKKFIWKPFLHTDFENTNNVT